MLQKMIMGNSDSGGGTSELKFEWSVKGNSTTQTFTLDPSKSYLIIEDFRHNSSGGMGISTVEGGVLTNNSPASSFTTVSLSGNTLTMSQSNAVVLTDIFIFSFSGAFDSNGLIS